MSFNECFIKFDDFNLDKDKISFYENLFWVKGMEYHVCIGLIPSDVEIEDNSSFYIRRVNVESNKIIKHNQLLIVPDFSLGYEISEKIMNQVSDLLFHFRKINYIKYPIKTKSNKTSILVYFDAREEKKILEFLYIFFQRVSVIQNDKNINNGYMEIEPLQIWCELL